MKKQLITRDHDNATLESIRATVDKMVQDIGIDDMTIRGICSEVGITVGTFYHYFSSKNDLLLDRYIRYMDYFEDFYEKELVGIDEIEALKLLIRKHLDYGKSRVYKIYKRYFQIMIDEYERWATVKQNSVAMIIERVVLSGQEKGEITKKYNANDICLFLMSFVNGMSIQYFTRDKNIMENRNLIEMIDKYIDSLKL